MKLRNLITCVMLTTTCSTLTTLHGAGPLPPHEATDIIRKAVKAHGGIKALSQFAKTRILQTDEVTDPMTGKCLFRVEAELIGMLPDRCYVARTIKGLDGKVIRTSGHFYDGSKGWIVENKMTRECTANELTQLRYGMARQHWSLLLYPMLSDPSLTFTVLPEAMVEKDRCIRVRVEAKGRQPFVLFFSTTSGRLRKAQVEIVGYQGEREIREIVLTDYKTIRGGLFPVGGYEIHPSGRVSFVTTSIEINPRVDISKYRPEKP